MIALAALAAALAVAVLGLRPGTRRPAATASGAPGPAPAGRESSGTVRGGPAAVTAAGSARRLPAPFVVAGAALAAWSLAGARAGPVAALLVGAAAPRLLAALPTRAHAERERACAVAVPLLADLVAACVAAGAPTDVAVEHAAGVVGGPLGADAANAARAVRLGVPAAFAWAPLLGGERPAPVRGFAAALVRSADSGAAPAAVLRAVADDARAAARTAGEAAARRAAAAAVLPLGLCFLPAFVLAGVVPLVAGLLAGAL